jgi:hypothetical protein
MRGRFKKGDMGEGGTKLLRLEFVVCKVGYSNFDVF